MNQILNTDITQPNNTNSHSVDYKYNKKRKFFYVQLLLSIIAILIFSSFYLFYKISLNKQEKFSNSLMENYKIMKLYSNNSNIDTSFNNANSKDVYQDNFIVGVIEIPLLHLSYPLLSEFSDELLKFSPCIFYGNMPDNDLNNDMNNNLCIAGHNYDNDKFFSKISLLKNNDEILIYNNDGDRFLYSVFKNYEVKENDLSPIYKKLSSSSELTLITCNNFNNNRIIIKARKESID